MRFLFAIVSALILSSCGVKAPPVAPEEKIENTLLLNCSPQDPKCDAVDPNYKRIRR